MGMSLKPSPNVIEKLRNFWALTISCGQDKEEVLRMATEIFGIDPQEILKLVYPRTKKLPITTPPTPEAIEPQEDVEMVAVGSDSPIDNVQEVTSSGDTPISRLAIPAKDFKILIEWIKGNNLPFQSAGQLTRAK